MSNNKVARFENPTKELVNDSLSDFLKESAQKMLKVAVEAEVNEFLVPYNTMCLSNGSKRVVRNGYLPEREIQTGIGNIKVSVPRVRDRNNNEISFSSNLIPQYMRRTKTIDVLLPLLYLKGISTKDFSSSFEPILGFNPKNISPNVISRLKEGWYDEYIKWRRRDLSDKKYVYFWADGIYLQARMESSKNCILVIIGADDVGNKEIVAIEDGFRESKESWSSLLLDLKKRGLTYAPKIAVGDGALGFWGALTEVYPATVHQRCWVHKTRNILNKLSKYQQEKAKEMIHEIYMAATKKESEIAWKKFVDIFSAKYPKVVECLVKDQKELLSFYDFPAEHWIHLRTTNPIESTFASVKHRSKKSKNCFSRRTVLASTFKLLLEAEKRWRPLRCKSRIAEVINLVKFIDGVSENEIEKIKNSEEKNVA